jgi:hypothetical protein
MPNGFENGASAPKGDGNVGDNMGKHDSGESRRLDSSEIFGFKELGQKGSDTTGNKISEGTEAGQEGDKVKLSEQVEDFDKADHAAGVSDHLDNASQHLDKLKGTDQEGNAKNVLQEMGELMGKSAAEITGDKELGKSLGDSVGKGQFDAIKQAVGAAGKK